MRRIAIVAGAWLAFAACSLTTNFDDLTRGGGDAGSPTIEGGTDARPDVVADAGTDAVPDGPFCKSQTGYAFCADFDEGTVPFPFTESAISGATNGITYDTADFRSAPRSALLVGGAPADETASALIWRAPAVAGELVIDFDVRLEALGMGSFDIVGVERGAVALELEVHEDGVVHFDIEDLLPDGGGRDVVTPTSRAVPVGSWHHVQLSFKKNGTLYDVKAMIDGALAGNATISQELLAGPSDFYIGDPLLQVTSVPWKARFDDVLIVVR